MTDKPTFEQRTKMEHDRGRQVAADNAAKMEAAQAARKKEEDDAARAADPEGFAAKEEADKAAAEAKPLSGVFPHAAEPFQPGPLPTAAPPVEPAPEVPTEENTKPGV